MTNKSKESKPLSMRAAKLKAKNDAEKYRDIITEKIEITKRKTAVSLFERSPELLRLLASAVLADIEAGIPYYKGGRHDLNGNYRGCRQEGMFNPDGGSLGEYLKVREQKPQVFRLKARKFSRLSKDWATSVFVDEIAATIPEECDRMVAKLIAKEYTSRTHLTALDDFGRIDSVLDLLGIDKTQKLRTFAGSYANIEEPTEAAKELARDKKESLNKYLEDRERVLSNVPYNYADMFPAARKVKRHFVLHIGPTNSGKTYGAIEALEKAGEGVYLAPLRLLAVEQYERINEDGLACNLLTGEEEQFSEKARLLSATVEMADLYKRIPCAVVDECQMVSDTERGGAWTSAILGLPADEIHLCAAPSAERILIRMIEMCGDTYEVQRVERKTPLVVESGSFEFPKDVQPGDALIVFSRKNVHAVGADLQGKGYNVSIIYGALPPDVRNNQAEKFRTGKTDVVVSTDAIGMGMNLPIRRVVFLEQYKFDGHTKRMLKPAEAKQIAGRAGRFGIYDTGYVNSFGNKKEIQKEINERDQEVDTAMIDFPKALVGSSVKDAVRMWQEISMRKGFARSSTERLMGCAEYLEKMSDDMDLIYDLSSIPFDWNDDMARITWSELASAAIKGLPLVFNCDFDIRDNTDMQYLERWYKKADIMYSFADKFGMPEDKENVTKAKAKLSAAMIKILQEAKLKPRTCSSCGARLAWNYPYGRCDKCFRRSRGYYGYDYYGW